MGRLYLFLFLPMRATTGGCPYKRPKARLAGTSFHTGEAPLHKTAARRLVVLTIGFPIRFTIHIIIKFVYIYTGVVR